MSTTRFDQVVRIGSATYATKGKELVYYKNASILDVINMCNNLGVLFINAAVYKNERPEEYRCRYSNCEGTLSSVIKPDMVDLILCSDCPVDSKVALLKKMNFDKVPYVDGNPYQFTIDGDIYSCSEQRMVYIDNINALSTQALMSLNGHYDRFFDELSVGKFDELFNNSKLRPYLAYNPGKFFDSTNPLHVRYAYQFHGLNQKQQKAVYSQNYQLSFDGGRQGLRNNFLAQNDLNVLLGEDYSVFADMPPISAESFVKKIMELRGDDAFWKIAQYIEPVIRKLMISTMN